MVELMATSSKRAYAACCVMQVCCSQSPWPHGRPLLTHAFAGDIQTLKGRSGSVSVGSPVVHKVLSEPSECLWWVWDLILNAILPLLQSCWGFSFALGYGVSLNGGIQHSPDHGCSAVSCNFGLLTGEDEHTCFYSTILFLPGLKLGIQKTKIMVSSSISSWQIDGKTIERVKRLYFFAAPKSLQMVTAALKLKDACSLEEKLWPTRQHVIKQRHYFANKGPSSQSYGFSSSHVWWELDFKESWGLKTWCFWTVVLEKTLESPMDCKEIHQSILKESVLNIHWNNWC